MLGVDPNIGVGGEGAEHLRRGAVAELVKAAAQRLAIQCDAALFRSFIRSQGCSTLLRHRD